MLHPGRPRDFERLTPLLAPLPAPFHGSDKVLGYGLALAALWYFGGLMWRLRKGTAGVKPVEDHLADPAPPARYLSCRSYWIRPRISLNRARISVVGAQFQPMVS